MATPQRAPPSRPQVSQGAGPSTGRTQEIEEEIEEEEEAESPEPPKSMGKKVADFFKTVGKSVQRALTPKGAKKTKKTVEGVNSEVRQKAINMGLPVSLASGRGGTKRSESWIKANKQERGLILKEYEEKRPLLKGYEEEEEEEEEEEAGPSTKK